MTYVEDYTFFCTFSFILRRQKVALKRLSKIVKTTETFRQKIAKHRASGFSNILAKELFQDITTTKIECAYQILRKQDKKTLC